MTIQVTHVKVILYKVNANRIVDVGRGPLNSLRLDLLPKEMVGRDRALLMEAGCGAGHGGVRTVSAFGMHEATQFDCSWVYQVCM